MEGGWTGLELGADRNVLSSPSGLLFDSYLGCLYDGESQVWTSTSCSPSDHVNVPLPLPPSEADEPASKGLIE